MIEIIILKIPKRYLETLTTVNQYIMKVLTPGHWYRVDGFEDPEKGAQDIHFIHKEPVEGSDELVTVSDGTTNEELLEVLINRMGFLQSKFPCRENAIVLRNLEESLMWLEKRTKDRKARGVEGKHKS